MQPSLLALWLGCASAGRISVNRYEAEKTSDYIPLPLSFSSATDVHDIIIEYTEREANKAEEKIGKRLEQFILPGLGAKWALPTERQLPYIYEAYPNFKPEAPKAFASDGEVIPEDQMEKIETWGEERFPVTLKMKLPKHPECGGCSAGEVLRKGAVVTLTGLSSANFPDIGRNVESLSAFDGMHATVSHGYRGDTQYIVEASDGERFIVPAINVMKEAA